MLITEDNDKNDSFKDLKKDYPDKYIELEEVLLDYMGENDLKILKSGFPDKWNYLTKKLAYPFEFFNCIEDYKKPVYNLKTEDFFSNLKNKCPKDEEIKRTKGIFKIIDIKNGEKLTECIIKKQHKQILIKFNLLSNYIHV